MQGSTKETESAAKLDERATRPEVGVGRTVKELAAVVHPLGEGAKQGAAKGSMVVGQKEQTVPVSDSRAAVDTLQKEDLKIVTETPKKIDISSHTPAESAFFKPPDHQVPNANAFNNARASAPRVSGHQSKGSASTPRSGLFGWASSLLAGGEESDAESKGPEDGSPLQSPIPGGWGSMSRGGRGAGQFNAMPVRSDLAQREEAKQRADRESLDRERLEAERL